MSRVPTAWRSAGMLFALAALAASSLPQAQRPPVPKKPAPERAPAGASLDILRQNNLGVAYMNQLRFEQALKLFEQAAQSAPQLQVAHLNQGIALFNLQRYDQALAVLLEVTRREPGNARAWYNLGLLYKNLGQGEAAIDAFARVAQIDPSDADTQYFLGVIHAQLGQPGRAIADFERALQLNPFHASAEFGLARALQRAGETPKARQHLARFEKLTKDKLGVPMSQSYGDQGKFSLAEAIRLELTSVSPAIPVRFVPAGDAAGLATAASKVARPTARDADIYASAQFLGSGACFFDFDGDGRPDLFLASAGEGRAGALYRNLRGRFEDVTRSAGLELPSAGLGCAAGDYDNDGRSDLVVALKDRVRLFHNEGNGKFRDSTEAAGVPHIEGAVGVMFLDYDHDGDLDVYVTRAATSGGFPGNLLLRNNGNGTFTNWTAEAGLGSAGASLASASTDFNNDRAIDLVVTGNKASPELFVNPREGEFRVVQPWRSPMPAPTVGVAVFDFDKDGWMDLAFTHVGPPGLTLWRNIAGKRFERVPLPKLDWTRGWGVVALDFDNDGWLDLAAVGENDQGGKICLLRNLGPRGFAEVTPATGLSGVVLVRPRAIVAADYDGDGDADLLITQEGGPPVLLRNDGGNRNNWLRIALRGVADNRAAIGTRVELYAGALYQKWEVQSSSGYLGQGAQEILAGLGEAKQADIVRLLWPTGVLQDEVQIASRTSPNIAEIDRRGSSCPILFVWNGNRYQFIADALGPGVVGHWVGPGQWNVPDPTEYLKVDGAQVRLRGGLLSIRLIEPMEEVVYLDQVRLLAVDHRADSEVYPNEYFASNPPFPEFKVIVARGARPPRGAWDDRGRDILPELRNRDRRYVTDFPRAPFKGFAKLHSVELDLGEWSPDRPLRLLLHGLTDYFTATSMFAAHQAGVDPIAPYVEALEPSGRWVRVMDDMGFPAGLARTMVADLTGRLPAGTRRIRITTNLVIYWDQILVDMTPPGTPIRVSEAPLVSAWLRFGGYPLAIEGNPPADLVYDYDQVSATGPYARAAGNYTRYGDARALLAKSDDRFAIFGSGDEVDAEFDPQALPPLRAGWKRDFFFFADGFEKDMDFYAAHGDTVEPLPFHGMSRYPYAPGDEYPSSQPYLQDRVNYDTRQESGRAATSFRLEYKRRTKSLSH